MTIIVPTYAPPSPDALPSPEPECDIVMKGGITSGIVYPLAVVELARSYRFRQVGGASAGAIAAGAAAAAERGRGVPGAGFGRLATLPLRLSQNDTLFKLFQPHESTRAVFETLTAGMGHTRFPALRVLVTAAMNCAPGLVLGALPGVALLITAWGANAGALRTVALTTGALFAVVGGLSGIIAELAIRASRAIAANGFGLCTGLETGPESRQPALMPWLSTEFNALAGKDPADGPLTFEDLWGGRDASSANAVRLQMIT